ncbi:MAG: MarR family winged helix-turn-helix transcriptional regulator [Acidimicrobiales bacterium]
MTKWLDPTEDRLWRGFLEVSVRAFDLIDDALRDNTGLSLDDYEVLVYLSESEHGRLRMSELADRMLHSRSRLTHRIDRMVADGLVERADCPHDRRGVEAVLTAQGRRRLEAAAPGHVEAVRRVFIDRFDESEKQSVATAFERIASELRPKLR